MNALSWHNELPAGLQQTAQKVLEFIVSSRGLTAAEAQLLICDLSQRAWLIEQHNKLIMGRLISDNAPFDTMLHDASRQLISDELLADEAAHKTMRQQGRNR